MILSYDIILLLQSEIQEYSVRKGRASEWTGCENLHDWHWRRLIEPGVWRRRHAEGQGIAEKIEK